MNFIGVIMCAWKNVVFVCSKCKKSYTYNTANVFHGTTDRGKEVYCPHCDCGHFQHFEDDHEKFANEALDNEDPE